MKIAISVDYTQGGMRGGDVYTVELTRQLARIDPANQYVLFGYFFNDFLKRREAIPLPEADNFARLIKRWPQGLINRVDRNWGLPFVEAYLRSQGVRLFHSPGPALPRLRQLRSVITFHDLIPYAHPRLMPAESVAVWQKAAREGVETATAVLASSTATKEDLMRFLRVPEKKIKVVLLGVNGEIFHPISDPARLDAVGRKYGLPERFILSAGPYEPRRNWEGILRGLALLPPGEALGAVFTGGVPPVFAASLDRLRAELGLLSPVIRTGYVPREDLAALYNLAAGFVYPSFYDGFNLPMLEAMACGTPAAVSSAGALPEIAGGACWLVDPHDPDSIAEGIRKTLEPATREKLREKGLRCAAERNWEKTARATLSVYEEAGA